MQAFPRGSSPARGIKIGSVTSMIQCHVCGEFFDRDDMYIVGDYEIFTYLDAVVCRPCLSGIITYCDKANVDLWGTSYTRTLEDLLKSPLDPDERECPECGGIMIWDVFDDTDGFDSEGEVVFKCLNCGFWVYCDSGVMKQKNDYQDVNNAIQ